MRPVAEVIGETLRLVRRGLLAGLVLLGATSALAENNNAQFVSQSGMTSTTVPGQVYAITMTFQNTGDTTWSAAGTYRLAAGGAGNDTTWGPSRIELPNSVAPGASVTFNFNVTAPAEYGWYNFKWHMVKDDVGLWFGNQSTYIGVQNGINASQFISHTMPASTTPGGSVYGVTVTMKNTGNTTWTAGTGYRLGSLDPQGYWGVVEAALPGPVAPNENAVFSFNITSPAAWGTYPVRYVMRKGDPYGWFGPMTEGNIVNGTNESQFISQSVPSTMTAGQSYPISITMKNTSGTAWTAANTYGLGALVPWGTNPWGITRVQTPGTVASGENVTFNFNVTAPTTPGTHDFRWKMLRDELNNWFGDISTNVAVTVQAANTLYFIHPDHLNTPRLVADAAGTTVWRWDQAEPFGVNTPDENPSGLGAFDLPLRLPGQYFDKETNNHHNYFRDYDPSLGRYGESDPIGLRGGLNGYVYAFDPLTQIDSLGLMGRGPGGGSKSQQQWPREMHDFGPCNYYDQKCRETGCFYYCQTAPRVCRNAQSAPSPYSLFGPSKLNCVRRCLEREDRKIGSPNMCPGRDCPSDPQIDDYHKTCFTECGVPPVLYPGVNPPWFFNLNPQ